MPIHNLEIANKFNKLADLLEIRGENPFRVRAYRTAARVVAGLNKNVADLIEQDIDLTELPGIGNDLAEKIKTIVKTGELPILKHISTKIPSIVSELLRIDGLGPKRVQVLYKKLHIKNVDDLKKALKDGRVRKLHGFGEKMELNLAKSMEMRGGPIKRIPLMQALPVVSSLIRYLERDEGTKRIECAGSIRRRKETIGDIDLLASGKNSKAIIDRFIHYDEVSSVLAKGPTRSTVYLHSGTQVDLRVVPENSFGAALIYFTGSKDHNIAIRKIAVKKKLKLNEYGLYKGKKQIAGKSEIDIYEQLGLSFIEPELREDRGEIKAAQTHSLPTLIRLEDIRGDLHSHTNATDGKTPIEIMVKAAQALGREYLAISDHSQRLAMTHGLDKKRLRAQIEEIDKIQEKFKNIKILKSIEVDILEDGSLDLPREILKKLDLTICSIHSKFDLSEKKQTERIIKAMDNPYFNILGHPTGRLINKRNPYAINIERIFSAAKNRGCVLELNAQPWRLDLNDDYCKTAKEMGVKIAINTDAHSPDELQYMQFGIYQARRGWLGKEDVINTSPLSKLMALLKR